MSNLFSRLFFRKRVFARNAARHTCRIEGDLILVDSGVVYSGQVQNLSLGGAMFRPRLAYLLNRRGTPARLRIGDRTIEGSIVSTTPSGFGISFASALDEAALDHILAYDQTPA